MSLIRLRGGTAAEWSAANPVLAAREVGVVTDSHRLKVGDGSTAWNSLPYADATAGLTAPYTAKTATYVATVTDRVINCTANSFTVTLPAAATAGAGKQFTVKNSGTGTVTVDGNGSETIDGALNVSLYAGEAVEIVCTGSGWVVV